MKKLKFTEIKKPYDFVLKIKKIIQGFKNLIIYLPVIWKDKVKQFIMNKMGNQVKTIFYIRYFMRINFQT